MTGQVAPAGQPPSQPPAARVDDTHRTVELPSALVSGDQMQVSARGGSAARRDAGSAFYAARADVAVRTSLTTLRPKGRAVTATLGLSGARQGTFDAYDQGQAVASVVHGPKP